MKEKIKHLLIPKQFRVYCRPNHLITPGMVTTTKPSETGCANCLTAFRTKTQGNSRQFLVKHAADRKEPDDYPEWRTPVLPENL